MVIEQKQHLLERKDYFDRFYEIKGGDLSDRAAFELIEDEYFKLYNKNRYSSYPSFKSNKWKYLNKLLQVKTNR